MRAMLTLSRMMDLDFTQMCLLVSSPSASLEPSRQATLAQSLRLREIVDGVTHKTQPTPTKPNRAQGLKTPKLPRLHPTRAPDARIRELRRPISTVISTLSCDRTHCSEVTGRRTSASGRFQ